MNKESGQQDPTIETIDTEKHEPQRNLNVK